MAWQYLNVSLSLNVDTGGAPLPVRRRCVCRRFAARKPVAAKVSGKATAKAGKVAASGGSKFARRRLFPKVDSNLRRPGSHGERSLGIILTKPGITYAEFIRAGGRAQDLRWDAKFGHVEARAS